MATAHALVTEATVEFLNKLFASTPLENVSIRLWEGTLWPDDKPRAATIVLQHPGALRGMLAAGTAKGLGEAYLRDDFDVEGNFEKAIELALALENRPVGWMDALTNYYQLHRLPASSRPPVEAWRSQDQQEKQHSLRRAREAVSFHYDVSNEFYRLWLDREMAYSCAYFEKPDDTLEAAQIAKFRQLCRKLRLKPGQRLLDIGCGWGGLARYAARACGVEVTGITLSTQQAALAAQLASESGLDRQIKIELRDYREVKSPAEGFDAVVSVGMAEHVGRENLPTYFKTVRALLKQGGVFLNHAIGEGRRADRFQGPSFVEEYVFPDSDIPPLPRVLESAEQAGFEIRDVENLREHYTLTLRHWVHRLEESHERALTLVREATYRVWRLYMAASAHGFNHGDLAVYQTLLAKPGPDGHAGLPLTRRDWYVA